MKLVKTSDEFVNNVNSFIFYFLSFPSPKKSDWLKELTLLYFYLMIKLKFQIVLDFQISPFVFKGGLSSKVSSK